MAAYFIVDIQKIDDPQVYEEYRNQVLPTVERYGGRFIVRGGAYETIEGDWQPRRLVILEFENKEQFKLWYSSPEYHSLLEMRHSVSTARAVLIQGT